MQIKVYVPNDKQCIACKYVIDFFKNKEIKFDIEKTDKYDFYPMIKITVNDQTLHFLGYDELLFDKLSKILDLI